MITLDVFSIRTQLPLPPSRKNIVVQKQSATKFAILSLHPCFPYLIGVSGPLGHERSTTCSVKGLTASTAKNRLSAHLAGSACDSQPSYRKGACSMNRALLIGILSLILTVLVSSCQPSSPVNNTNAPSPT